MAVFFAISRVFRIKVANFIIFIITFFFNYPELMAFPNSNSFSFSLKKKKTIQTLNEETQSFHKIIMKESTNQKKVKFHLYFFLLNFLVDSFRIENFENGRSSDDRNWFFFIQRIKAELSFFLKEIKNCLRMSKFKIVEPADLICLHRWIIRFPKIMIRRLSLASCF
jgi:hypothetical protein